MPTPDISYKVDVLSDKTRDNIGFKNEQGVQKYVPTVETNPLTGGVALAAGDGIYGLNGIIPRTADRAGIVSAMTMALATGMGLVTLLGVDYAVDADIPLMSNVSIVGYQPRITFVGNIPDQGYSATGGTRMVLSAGVKCFTWNNVDKGAKEVNIATFALGKVKLFGMAFMGGAKAVDVGAYHAMGPVFCEFDELYGFDQTSDFAFDFKNFQHCQFGRIFASSSPSMLTGGGVRFASQLDGNSTDGLLPGNSQVTGEIFTYCSNRLNRSIVIEASGPSGCVLNQMNVSGRLQGNRYGASAVDSISCGFTSGSANITVPDGTKFKVGVPLVWHSTAPAGLTVDVVYFVKTIVGNTITVSEDPYTNGADAVATATGSHTASFSGFPSVEFRASLSTNSINNSDFGQIDAEAYKNVCAVLVSKLRNCRMFLSEVMASETNTSVVPRDSDCTLEYAGLATITCDLSANFGGANFVNLAGGAYIHQSGDITLNSSWHGRTARYSGAADIAVKARNFLPKGFKLDFTPTAATGIATFSNMDSGAGGVVWSYGGKLRTAGQYATAKLRNVGNKVFTLSGDLQV